MICYFLILSLFNFLFQIGHGSILVWMGRQQFPFLTILKVIRSVKILTLMLNFNQKYICVYDLQSSKHYIASIDLEPYTLTFTRLLYTYPFNYNFLNSYINPSPNPSTQPTRPTQEQIVPTFSNTKKYEEMIRVINFKEVFQKMGICVELCIRKQLYLPQLDKYCLFQELSDIANCVPIEYTDHSVLLLRFTYVHHIPRYSFLDQNLIKEEENGELDLGGGLEDVKERDRSRSIGEIMQYVRKWRHIAEQGINGVKVNLQVAAAYVGIPKKSLDDYFYQLRVGQKYDFDFENNMNKNISFLRKFVKSKVPSRHREKMDQKIQSSQKSEEQFLDSAKKLPKKLKQKAQTKSEIKIQTFNEHQDNKVRLSDSEVSSIQHAWPNTFLPKQGVFDEQDSFFNDFKFGNESFVEFNHLLKNQDHDPES